MCSAGRACVRGTACVSAPTSGLGTACVSTRAAGLGASRRTASGRSAACVSGFLDSGLAACGAGTSCAGARSTGCEEAWKSFPDWLGRAVSLCVTVSERFASCGNGVGLAASDAAGISGFGRFLPSAGWVSRRRKAGSACPEAASSGRRAGVPCRRSAGFTPSPGRSEVWFGRVVSPGRRAGSACRALWPGLIKGAPGRATSPGCNAAAPGLIAWPGREADCPASGGSTCPGRVCVGTPCTFRGSEARRSSGAACAPCVTGTIRGPAATCTGRGGRAMLK